MIAGLPGAIAGAIASFFITRSNIESDLAQGTFENSVNRFVDAIRLLDQQTKADRQTTRTLLTRAGTSSRQAFEDAAASRNPAGNREDVAKRFEKVARGTIIQIAKESSSVEEFRTRIVPLLQAAGEELVVAALGNKEAQDIFLKQVEKTNIVDPAALKAAQDALFQQGIELARSTNFLSDFTKALTTARIELTDATKSIQNFSAIVSSGTFISPIGVSDRRSQALQSPIRVTNDEFARAIDDLALDINKIGS